ncbi:MAG TPA: class I SAM-dependent methyltransferase [Pyrinomonadaceae bacterium]|nr:class I SAM-dependent methyltransferase [Pyrinomonadaceae bacterium]
MNTREDGKRREAVYDGMAAGYDRAIAPMERWFLARLRARTLLEIPAGAALVLEVGAGTGLNFRYYPKATRGVAGEPSREMIKIAKGKERPTQIDFVQSCAESLPFADASFDAALATLVFCSVESPRKSFAELRRVVRPGGRIALLEHVRPENLLAPVFDLLSILTVALCEDHFNRRTAREAESAGLRLIKVERHLLGIFQIIVCEV